ncbi:DUF6090 family protein [Aegicerativicinus sediminis]|uniref:DUF6090 family protein n=1 Tax=Aegicerativicinus sediminis TaxID=2893202 RepID=UPI001E30AAF6|nr:DUF6090 family protein [Aegicerativicinus sediminis]
MFKFYRRIHHDLMEKNKTGKYFKYAIGEIVLVVIGILIALQINNWNEQRKFNREIADVLIEVRSNLISDSLNIHQTYIERLEDINIQSTVINALEKGSIPYDSLEYDLGRVLIYRRIVLIDNGYQLMKKFGLERLKNKELRNKLVNYYTTSIKEINDDTADDEHEFFTVYLPYIRNHFLDWEWNERGIPADYENLKSDQYFLTSLKLNITNIKDTSKALERGANNIRQILPILDKTIVSYN